jgi:phosphatidylinositol alpha-1,6-mannosyltransferase
MLRVLMVTSVFPRFTGDATPPFVWNAARELAAQGIAVRVLAPHGEGARFRDVWEAGSSKVEILRFPYVFPLRLQKLCYDGGMLVNFRTRPWTKWLLPFFLAAQILALLWLVLRWRPHVIHSHSLLPQGFTAALVAGLTGTPHVTTSHGNDVFGLRPDGLMGRLKRWVLAQADAVTVNSSATEEAVRALGVKARKVHRIPAVPNAAPVDRVLADEIRARATGGEEMPVFAFVGRMIEDKGVGELLEACALLCKDVPRFRVLLVGEGQDRAVFARQAEALRLVDHLYWAGWVPSADVSSWMAAADALIVPSRESASGWKEAQGLVAVEAMLAGVPVVASRLGGLPDMVEDGVTGRLVPPNDPVALARALADLLRDPTERARLASRARAKALAIFSPAAVTAATEALYREVWR